MTPAEIAAEALDDPVFFCRYFLPHMFPGEMPWVHRGLLAILTRRTGFLRKYGQIDKIVRNFVYEQDGKLVQVFRQRADGSLVAVLGRYTLVMLPRGFAKTTIAGNAVPLWNILFHEVPFGVYISESATHAIKQLDNIKRELESNERILAVFGPQKPDRNAPQRWAADEFETVHGMAMVARGRGSQIRGLKHRQFRPKLILFDDLEDKESVSTEEQRKKVREWAYGDMMPAIGELDPDASIVGLGTLLHPDALLSTLSRDPQWTVVRFGVRDRDGDWLWPEMINARKYEVKRQSAALAGELATFYMEYENVYRDESTARFRADFIRHDTPPGRDRMQVAVYCDPAISSSRTADFFALAAVGMEQNGTVWVLDIFMARGLTPREQVDKYFEFLLAWRPNYAGVEAQAYQAALLHMIREEMFRRKFYMEVQPVRHAKAKAERINGLLQPRYAAGYVRHARRFPEYEAQLLDFPNGKHDDGPDAVSGALGLLNPAVEVEPGGLSADSMPPLRQVFGGDWRNRRV